MGRSFYIMALAGTMLGGSLPAPSAAASADAERPAAQQPPPPLPSRSPVDFFREILAMTAVERQEVLTNRSVQARTFLEAKLKEFEPLSPEAREARLQTLQLRWYLLPLMKAAPAQRANRLEAIPESDRRLVEERLEQWDLVPADLQTKVLENENVIRLFFRSETNLPPSDSAPINLTPQQREQLEKDRARWNALPEDERGKIHAQFQRFFELSDREKARILNVMDEEERKQMERALVRYERLPAPQRAICLRNFQRFASLSLAERREFLRNAERWQTMSAEDRQLWRDLVNRIKPQPPLPPGLRPKGPPLPPGMVPKPPRPPTASGQATN